MMGDDSDDDKPLLFQFKNSKGSVQAKCSARNGATNSSQKSIEKPIKNVKGSDDEDDDKPLRLTLSNKHPAKSAQKVAAVVDANPRTAAQPLNGLTMKMGAHNLASVKVYTKRKKQLGDEATDNVVAKKLKLSNCGASSKDDDDDDDFDIPLLSNSSAKRKKHSVGVSVHHVVESRKTSVTLSASVVSMDTAKHNEENKNNDGLKIGNEKEDAVDDTNASEDGKCKENVSDDDDDNCGREHGADVNDSDDNDIIDAKDDNEAINAIDAKDVDDSDFDDANGSRDHADDPTGNIDNNDRSNDDVEDSDDDADCDILLSKQFDAKKKTLANKSGNGMDDPRLSFGVHHIKSKSSNASSKLEARLNLVKEEDEEDDLPLSKMSHSKRVKDPAMKDIRFPANKNAVKQEDNNKVDDGCDTKRKKYPDKKVAETSKLSSIDSGNKLTEKKENDVKDVSAGRTPGTNKKVLDVKEGVSEKGTDMRVGLSCESRRQQLLALSKSLEDTDSEEEREEEEEESEEVEEEDDVEEEEEEEEDVEVEEEEDDDDDYNGSVAAKTPAAAKVKRCSGAKMPSTSSKARPSVKSKIRTPISSSKSAKKIVVDDDGEEGEEEESEEEEEEEESEEEDEEWEEEEDDQDYGASRAKKRRKTKRQTTGSKKGKQTGDVKEKQPRKTAKKLKDAPGAGGGQKWTSLEHSGVIFPPFYQPHGIRMLYEGKPVDLTPEQEEVATMFAVMKETDYALKPKFLANFWNDWKKLLGSNHVIQKLEGCDFTPIYEWHLAEKEKKQKLTAEEKKAMKEEKLKQEEKYMWAVVDGVKEKVGNFRVEPPGLFRGRGEHPKMGKVKRRIYPEDIVINIGADSPVPECPLPGHSWKEVRHDDTVTWLAYWNDPINTKEQKYVFLSPSSTLKGQSDKEKYEKARVLKDYILDIRKTYTENFASSDPTTRQIAVATYLIDELALRAGNEKEDDEADTVGCCSLKVEHVSLVPPSFVEFDFLGKDSIRYLNNVKVVKPVYEAIGDFKKDKTKGMDLFDRLDTYKLNAHLKNIMPQLTAKVFRTYNASITLDTLLVKTDGILIPEKITAYQLANKEVAILCNHQRSVSKSHGTQMERLEGKLTELSDLLDEMQKDLERAKKGKPPGKDVDGSPKKNQNPNVLERKILQTKQKMERMKLDMKTKEDLKTVALGTSKINYMDPRITVAWCKQHEVPIEKIFNKSLLAKFAWAMDVDMTFHF